MKLLCLIVLLPFLAAATAAPSTRIPAPQNGMDHTRRDRRIDTESPEPDGGWEPNDTRRPRTGQSGWQFRPSNKWKAPRDAKAEKRRDAERRRRMNGGSRLRLD